MVEFHATGYGRKFFDADLPKLTKAITKLGNQLERFNFNMEGISLANITVEGEKLEPFIRKMMVDHLSTQIRLDREMGGVAKRGNDD